MVEMCEALDRRRGKGPQTIRVERVVVQDGGQAVVAGTVMTGTLPPGTALPTSEATPQAISQNASPMSIVDVVPVEARGRGGE